MIDRIRLTFALASLCLVTSTLPASAQESTSPTNAYIDTDGLVAQATEKLRSTGSAPVLRDGALVRHPFGLSEAVLNCSPSSFCDLELQAGETILGVAAEPTWVAERLLSGSEPTTPHLILKPNEWGAASALLVTTSRRSYHVRLTADPNRPIDSYVGYYYPRDLIRFQADQQQIQVLNARRQEEAAIVTVPDLAQLHCDYRIRGKVAPQLVCDDGIRTYLLWDGRHASPAIFAVDDEGKRSLLNHRIKGSWYILDAISDSFELKAGRQIVRIHRSGR